MNSEGLWKERCKLRLTPPEVQFYEYLMFPSSLSFSSRVVSSCETWSLTLREEHRLRVFENRVLRRMFRPKRGEMTGE
jgi:hypothetical protein